MITSGKCVSVCLQIVTSASTIIILIKCERQRRSLSWKSIPHVLWRLEGRLPQMCRRAARDGPHQQWPICIQLKSSQLYANAETADHGNEPFCCVSKCTLSQQTVQQTEQRNRLFFIWSECGVTLANCSKSGPMTQKVVDCKFELFNVISFEKYKKLCHTKSWVFLKLFCR